MIVQHTELGERSYGLLSKNIMRLRAVGADMYPDTPITSPLNIQALPVLEKRSFFAYASLLKSTASRFVPTAFFEEDQNFFELISHEEKAIWPSLQKQIIETLSGFSVSVLPPWLQLDLAYKHTVQSVGTPPYIATEKNLPLALYVLSVLGGGGIVCNEDAARSLLEMLADRKENPTTFWHIVSPAHVVSSPLLERAHARIAKHALPGREVFYQCEHLEGNTLCFHPSDEYFHEVREKGNEHCMLLTSIAPHTVPLVRYRIDARVTLRRVPCQCGSEYNLEYEE